MQSHHTTLSKTEYFTKLTSISNIVEKLQFICSPENLAYIKFIESIYDLAMFLKQFEPKYRMMVLEIIGVDFIKSKIYSFREFQMMILLQLPLNQRLPLIKSWNIVHKISHINEIIWLMLQLNESQDRRVFLEYLNLEFVKTKINTTIDLCNLLDYLDYPDRVILLNAFNIEYIKTKIYTASDLATLLEYLEPLDRVIVLNSLNICYIENILKTAEEVAQILELLDSIYRLTYLKELSVQFLFKKINNFFRLELIFNLIPAEKRMELLTNIGKQAILVSIKDLSDVLTLLRGLSAEDRLKFVDTYFNAETFKAKGVNSLKKLILQANYHKVYLDLSNLSPYITDDIIARMNAMFEEMRLFLPAKDLFWNEIRDDIINSGSNLTPAPDLTSPNLTSLNVTTTNVTSPRNTLGMS